MGPPGRGWRRVIGSLVFLACFSATWLVVTRLAVTPAQRDALREKMRGDAREAFASAPSVRAPVSQPAPAIQSRPVVHDFWTGIREAPGPHLVWYLGRVFQTVWTTADRRFERPLLALHLMWMIPALWGAIIASRHEPWRRLLIMAACFTLVFWSCAALLEPLARNLTPIGGFGIMFGLVGWADAYERFFGRRLLEGDRDAVRTRL
jgi:hypothetical protein